MSIVYWANLSQLPDKEMFPKPLLKDLANLQSNPKSQKWLQCPAVTTRHKNTFMTTFPKDIMVDFEQMTTSDILITPREGVYQNSYGFDWEIPRIFFSEESQLMETSPAFLHRTSYAQFGHAPSGSFDIGQWFRPSYPTFQMWSDKMQFIANKGEAHLYFNFPNNNKVVLQQFNMSEKLIEIMNLCVNYKFTVPKQSLSAMYQMFANNKLKREVLTEIKQHLIL